MNSSNEWNATDYDEKLHFVSEFGKSVVELLQPQRGETILDLGCGTGDLTHEISKSGATVIGLDSSEKMIEQAREKYPDLQFIVGNGENFRLIKKVDAVFSNAALHWMKQASQVVESIQQVLKQGGRFVAEFGGKGNIQTLVNGITDVLKLEHDIDSLDRNPWYFPSIGEYSTLLENNGFKVTLAQHFERPTPLTDGDQGMNIWLDNFASRFFSDFSQVEKLAIYDKIKEYIRPSLFKNGTWVADYERLRIIAVLKAGN